MLHGMGLMATYLSQWRNPPKRNVGLCANVLVRPRPALACAIVVMGSFRVHSTSGWEATAYAGEVLDWQPNDPHEFVALESGSKLVNIVK